MTAARLNEDADASPVPAGAEQLYSPAMLSELLGVSVRTVRRWQQVGLLVPANQVMGLPYFGYAELAVARQLAKWMQQGASVQCIYQQLLTIGQRIDPPIESVVELIQEWPISADGKRLVLRHGEAHIEATGQFRLQFTAPESEFESESKQPTIPFVEAKKKSFPSSGIADRSCDSGTTLDMTLPEMLHAASQAEDEEDLDQAVIWYRTSLAMYGANAEISFQVAELLYRIGDIHGARERYYVAIELDPNLVEARANLGCVLAECGQMELAIAAFRGALEQYADYADVHFHLARALDDVGQELLAVEHWQRFIELAPASPWADEACTRLNRAAPLLDL
ncbi:MAG: MerR family transcriptional regulator [Planctomycetales bacterium]|nr:MerR family transcriptional regulator [Planctomycetales bacterium]